MKKIFAVRLPDEQREKLKEIATAEDRSVSAVIRIMIAEGIKRKEEKVKNGQTA